MADESDEALPTPIVPLAQIGSAIAPFIYFDGAPNFGFSGGVANITLEALTYTSVDNKIVTERVVVAHLRMSGQAMTNLKKAIEGIELLANPVPEGRAN
jgi:hypothetical protein